MNDREKTTKEFEYQVRKAHGEGWDFVDLTTEDGYKILELLKEQEAVKPQRNHLLPGGLACGNCGMCISGYFNYCPYCGRAVNWNDE